MTQRKPYNTPQLEPIGPGAVLLSELLALDSDARLRLFWSLGLAEGMRREIPCDRERAVRLVNALQAFFEANR